MTGPSTSLGGWQVVRFGDVVRCINRTTRDPAADGLDRIVGLDHMDPRSLPLRRWDQLDDLPDGTSFTRTFKAGQVLFGKRRAYQRKVSVPDFDGVCSGDILVFEVSNGAMLPEFLPYVVQSDEFFEHALDTSAGSLSPRTKWQELAKYEFAIPPLHVQERVIQLLKKVDQVAAAYSRVGERCKPLRQALFLEVIAGQSATQAAAWGRVRSDVRLVHLGDLAQVARGASPRPKGNPAYFAQGRTEHHWIMISDLTRSRSGKCLLDTAEFLTPEGVEKSRPVKPGDLLLTNCATVGVPVFSGISGCIHDGFLVFDNLDSRISVEYLYRLLEYLTPWFRSIAQTGTQANLNTGIIKDLEVPLLPTDEQNSLTRTLDSLDELESTSRTVLQRLMAGRRSLLSTLGREEAQ